MHEKPSQGADRFRELQRVLDAALDAPHDARPAVLDDMCRGDAELRRDVARMLAACETDDGFLDAPVALFAEPLLADILPRRAAPGLGTEIGDYRIVGNLGHGGMGTVFAAERRDGTGDRVALKLVTPGMESERAIRRFAQERRILGSLDHPAIARLLDAGVTPEGVPFLVMELIDGRPIDRYCDDRRLPIDARLALFCRVCDAVRYAHENHVIHRDLKPRNLLVTADGDLKLLDFGIAKLLAEAPVEDLLVTTATFRPMTPEFASPEQLRAETLTPASDIYSLGILLTILLSGHHPHRILGLHRAELTRIVLRQDPEPPSKALMRVGDSALESREELTPAGIAAARSTTVDELAAALTGPLDTIALTALATDPARRFSSADALATAIRRHLDGRPIAPSTLRARLGSLFRRDGRSRRGES